jgi:ATP-dependent RNA helicase DeaD
MIQFSDLSLQPQLVQVVTELGYTEPTPIQAEIIPLLLAGHDVIGQAQTGTGKTAAFALPIIQNLDKQRKGVQSLVLTPTRELALQVANALMEYSQIPGVGAEEVRPGRNGATGVKVLAVYGGQSYSRQIGPLKRGVDVVVGTPGRILDLIQQKYLDLSQVKTVILDEADEMLSMGFIEDIETILKETPSERQTGLFSATIPSAVRDLAERYMREPQSIAIQREQVTVDAIEQRYYLVNETDKLAALTRLFEFEPITSALIFVRTRAGSGELANELTVRGFPAEVLNGDLTQEAREQVMNRFRQNQIKVLVATDVAARGLDIDDISHVFNYDLPEEDEIYVHRIGRTGRAGKTGIALTLVTPREQWRLRRIERFARKTITRANLPTEEDIINLRETSLFNKMEVWLRRGQASPTGRYRREREMVAKLVEAGYAPEEIAAAALKLSRADEKQRPIAAISEVVEKRSIERGNVRTYEGSNARSSTRGNGKTSERSNGRSIRRAHGNSSEYSNVPTHQHSREEGMVRLSLNRGKSHGLRPNDVVSTIAHYADIPGYSIGKILINDEHTLVDVPEELVLQVLAKTGSYRIHRLPVTVEVV